MISSTKYIGMDVHTQSISIAVMNSVGKVVMESVIETKASTILQFIDGLRGDLRVTFEEGTWAAWLRRAVVRLIQRWLNAGVLEDGKRIRVEEGTPQGGS